MNIGFLLKHSSKGDKLTWHFFVYAANNNITTQFTAGCTSTKWCPGNTRMTITSINKHDIGYPSSVVKCNKNNTCTNLKGRRPHYCPIQGGK